MEARSTDSVNEQSTTEPSRGVERHAVYFWDLVSFTVENRLFRVPKHLFVSGSPTFAKRHGLLAEDGCHSLDSAFPFAGPDVADKDGPIILDGVTITEFEVFLQLMFPQSELQLGGSAITELSKAQWLVVLKLSTAWGFTHHRKKAIHSLSTQISDPTELITLAREYSITKWLASGYEMLVQRKEAMTERMGDELGLLVAYKLCLLREEYAKGKASASPKINESPMSNKTATPRPPPPQMNVDSRIQTAFKGELDELARLEQVLRTKEEREVDEAARLEREAREEQAKLMEDEAARKENIRLEVEGARAKLAAVEEVHRDREAQLQLHLKELQKKANELEAIDLPKPYTQAAPVAAKSTAPPKGKFMFGRP